MKTARRKYQFRTRDDAEAAYRSAEQTSHLRVRGLMALMQGQVRWLDVPAPYQAGAYRFGVFDAESMGGMKVMVVFHPPSQQPHVVVGDAYEWASDTIADYARFGPSDDEGRTIQHMAYIVRQVFNDSLSA